MSTFQRECGMSGLRCRVGDLAVVVRAPAHPMLIGRIVRVIRLSPDFSWPVWESDPVLISRGIRVLPNDECLRPIRPDTDEPATETEREKETA